jgi:hypothetical protein
VAHFVSGTHTFDAQVSYERIAVFLAERAEGTTGEIAARLRYRARLGGKPSTSGAEATSR